MAEDDEVARLKRGDPVAIASAVGRYHHRLYRYLYRLVRDTAAAEDLYQQTWLNVVRRIGSYDRHSSFDTWLFAIAHNAAMDLLRRKTGESLEDREFALASARSRRAGIRDCEGARGNSGRRVGRIAGARTAKRLRFALKKV